MKSSNIKTIQPFGEFKFEKTPNHWFCSSIKLSSTNNIELTIEVKNSEQDLSEKIAIIKRFLSEIDSTMDEIYNFAHKRCFDASNVTLSELKQMYFLTAIELKKDNRTWWIVLEPSDTVETIYNHFLRFTLVNKEIVWSNLANNNFSEKKNVRVKINY